MIDAVDDFARWLQYRFRVRYGFILLVALAFSISATWFASRTSFSDFGSEDLVLFNDITFVVLSSMVAIFFWQAYAPSLREMTVPVYEKYARRAISNRMYRVTRFGLFGLMVVSLSLQLPSIMFGEDGVRSFSKGFVGIAPFFLFLYSICSMPLISQEKIQEYIKRVE
ncbi:hypothetical protein [Mesorhizobium sp. SP-1A]|uniref:hypothetical protein n=1 Tax=Mesorhizobium sp. SP-1A TaxID=3077840 RepID=UPI0028F723EF|nr:hypothetical protein [Mesorhizobium sp. SP-1A]